VAGSWTEVQLQSPPGGFASTDSVGVYFDADQTTSSATVKELTVDACIRIGL